MVWNVGLFATKLFMKKSEKKYLSDIGMHTITNEYNVAVTDILNKAILRALTLCQVNISAIPRISRAFCNAVFSPCKGYAAENLC